jgi:two-component system, chemotaxis family, protein-glutamate methylesterase/glutaminase
LLLARALPVIMVSDPTPAGAETTLAALDRGALDYVVKPKAGEPQRAAFADELAQKVRDIAEIDVRQLLQVRRELAQRRKVNGSGSAVLRSSSTAIPAGYYDACIAIAISTGGPPALAALFAGLQAPLPPIVIAKQMPPPFTAALAKRLQSLTDLHVKVAADGDELSPNCVLLAPGDKHLQVLRRAGRPVARVIDFELVSGRRPSADVLLHSVAEAFGDGTLGVIMTGPGRDGVAGCAAVKACGGYVLGQDEASSDVYGMNGDAFLEGYVDRQCSLDEAAATLQQLAAQRFAGRSC